MRIQIARASQKAIAVPSHGIDESGFAHGSHMAGLGHARRQRPDQKPAVLFMEDQARQIGKSRLLGLLDPDEG